MSYINSRYSPSVDRNIIPITTKFKCRTCGIKKTQDCFSNKEIGPYRAQLARKQVTLGKEDPLLRCSGCKGGQAAERQCEGPCGKWKVLNLFSKAQRSRGNGWCMECVQWKEGQHHEVDLTPAPGSAPQDFAAVPDEPEPTTGSTYAASVASLSSLSINGTPSGSQLPPHLRGLGSQIENRSQSSMSNPFEGARSADMPVDSSDGWSTRDSRRRAGPAMQFNAYDANGVRYTKEKAMTSTSQATSTIGAPSVASVASGPSRPAVNASRPAPTASRPAPAAANQPLVVTVNQNTGWAKPVGKRTEPQPVQEWAPEPEQVYRRSRYDSSDDEM